MHSTSVAPGRGTPTTLPNASPLPTDSDDVLPEFERALSALTDLELRHEIEMDCLEEWCGPGDVKQSLLAECEWNYQHARAVHLQRLALLQTQVRGSRAPH
jgi:hypothetical protein